MSFSSEQMSVRVCFICARPNKYIQCINARRSSALHTWYAHQNSIIKSIFNVKIPMLYGTISINYVLSASPTQTNITRFISTKQWMRMLERVKCMRDENDTHVLISISSNRNCTLELVESSSEKSERIFIQIRIDFLSISRPNIR